MYFSSLPIFGSIQLKTAVNLKGKSDREILKEVESFFQREFEYSLELAQQKNNSTPLSAFLLENRSGHCEYFATATTLLLRRLGIPTRYAIGYSVHEFSQLENQFIVRGRHAHAWTLVYVNGAWQVLDTTPASWVGIENTAAPSWEFILDLLSFCWFKLSQIGGIDRAKYLWWLIVLFISILLWWFKSKLRISPRQMLKSRNKYALAGFDSELYLIEKALNKSGLRRDPALTWKNWLEKVRDRLPTEDSIEDLKLILEFHYRDRFDPQGLTIIEKARLKSLCQLWLDKYGKGR